MDSFPTLAHSVDADVTPIGSVKQRFSLSRSDSEPSLRTPSLGFVARAFHGANLECSRKRRAPKNVPQMDRPRFHEFLRLEGALLTRSLFEAGQAQRRDAPIPQLGRFSVCPRKRLS